MPQSCIVPMPPTGVGLCNIGSSGGGCGGGLARLAAQARKRSGCWRSSLDCLCRLFYQRILHAADELQVQEAKGLVGGYERKLGGHAPALLAVARRVAALLGAAPKRSLTSLHRIFRLRPQHVHAAALFIESRPCPAPASVRMCTWLAAASTAPRPAAASCACWPWPSLNCPASSSCG